MKYNDKAQFINYIKFLFFFCRKAKHRDSTSESHVAKTLEVCKQEDDCVFVKPAEPKLIIEPKNRVSADCGQNKEKLVSILLLVTCI